MISPLVSDPQAPVLPLHSTLALDPHRTMAHQHSTAATQPPLHHHIQPSPPGLPLGPPGGLGSLQSLQAMNQLGMGVGYAVPMHMAPFRPLYMPSPDMAPMGVDPTLGSTGTSTGTGKPGKSSKSPAVGKRMKVSRACDECRRKKTRCDIDSENEMCSLCRRANVMCTFARQQLKRGPARKRSSQPLPFTGSASPPTAHRPAARARSQSTSDPCRRGKESPVLPPIESLLSYQKTFSNGLAQGQSAPIPIPQQRQRSVAYSGHDSHASPPVVDSQQPPAHPTAQPTPQAPQPPFEPQQHQSPYLQQPQTLYTQQLSPPHGQDELTNHQMQTQAHRPQTFRSHQAHENELSGFPVLVEVACSQSSQEIGGTEKPSSASVPSALSLALPSKSNGTSSGEMSDTLAGKAPTPPNYYDAGLHGVMHQALMEYYTFCHPVFPILPNSIAEFDAVFQDAGALRQCLVAAINAGLSGNIDVSKVPFGLGGSHIGGADREAHLMALLLVYINTLEYTWLGAAVAECAALNAEPLTPHTERLTALVAVLDRLNGVIFGTRSLFPADLNPVAMRYAPVVPTLTALLTPSAAADRFRTAPEIVLATLGQLGLPGSSKSELLLTLETLGSQVQRTPLEKFVQAALSRHRSMSEEPQVQ